MLMRTDPFRDLDRLTQQLLGTAARPAAMAMDCLLYTSDAADDLLCVDLGGRRIIKKKNTKNNINIHSMQ